jgi:chemotaxis protein CheY-P-specific phosphatase CheC
MAVDYYQQQFGEDVFEDTAPAAPTVSDEQIKAFVEANIGNPALIAETAAQYGVSVDDLSRATGYDSNAVVSYFQQADVAPPTYEPPPTGGLSAVSVAEEPTPPPPTERVEEPPPPRSYESISYPEEPVYEPPRSPKEIVERPEPIPTPEELLVYEPPSRPDEPPSRPKEPSYTPKPVDLGDGTFRTYGGTIIDRDGRPVTKTVDTTTATTPAATTLPTLTDTDGNQFDGTKLLTLAQQIANNAGSMTGGAFQTKNENIGFSVDESTRLLGRPPTASEQVLLDMARQMIQSGVTDLSQLKTQDITSSGVSVQIDPETNQYYALFPSQDGETSTRKELTPDQVAKIKTEEIMGSGGEGGSDAYIRRTIDDLVTGKGLFANGKMLTQQDAVDNPIDYYIGTTYTGAGGTGYQLKFDPKTGKSIVSANGFTTSDAESIMPIIMIASNFLMPGVGSMLTSTLVDAGMSEIVSQVVSKAVINGVTSGVMAEASGGKFGDGFLKGSITGAISAGVAPMISTALPSDLSPAVSGALTRAGTAAITALATGTDVGTAIGTQLLNSAVNTGLGAVTGGIGLSTADAKLLNSVLTPVVTQLVTNGNVNDATLMNAVLLAGSTVLANTGSNTVNNVSTLTTGSDADKTVGGLNLLASESGNETINNIASTVNTGLGAVSTATGLLNKATSLTKPVTKVNKTRANLTGALRTNTPTTRTAAVKPAALGALNTAKKTLSAQQMSQLKSSKPPPKVNVANLTPIKKPPQRVDVKTLIPVKKAQLPAGLNTKKMG